MNKEVSNYLDNLKSWKEELTLLRKIALNCNLSEDFKKSDLVMEVVNFLEKDKKRPICTPFSK